MFFLFLWFQSQKEPLHVADSIIVGKRCSICLVLSCQHLLLCSLCVTIVPCVLVQSSSVYCSALADTNVMCCYTERTPTPEVKKAATLPTASHKPPPVDQRPVTLQSSQRPLPPTPEDKRLKEKPDSEYQLCSLDTNMCEV